MPFDPHKNQESGLHALSDAFSPVHKDIECLQLELISSLACQTRTARDLVTHVFSGGGKRIRPALYFLVCNLFNYRGPHRTAMAVVCEYVHTASLLHDDVVDSSTLRRNKPTANSLWGDESAVLVGDLIYATASKMMAATGSLEVVSSFAQAICQMSEGELLQLESIFSFDMNEEIYFKILEGKTAVLIGTACKAAALLAHASQEETKAVEEFGQLIGLSFQLLDDALDFIGVEELFGKKHHADLREGKLTLPVILLKGLASDAQKQTLKRIFSQTSLKDDDIDVIQSMVDEYQTDQLTIEHAKKLTQRALHILTTTFPPSQERNQIENLATSLLSRLC